MRLKKLKTSLLFVFVIVYLNNVIAQDDASNIRVQIQELRNDNGSLYLSVFDDKEGFPSDEGKAVVKAKLQIIDGLVEFEFRLEPGEYAISVMHDENNNEELDTNFIGIPKEGIGASNDAQGFMGPPSFENAKFMVKSIPVQLIINIKYL